MKLIINIDENRFKDIQRIASVQIIRRSLTCEQIIANGTPLQAELEEIKAEIGLYYSDCLLSISENDEDCKICNKNVFESILRKIDNHISELKGENNETDN